jgi:hypothetical protein
MSRKTTVDECHRLRLRKIRPLESGAEGELRLKTHALGWKLVDTPTDLALRVRFFDRSRKACYQTIAIGSTRTGFGHRPWLVCDCGRRAGLLMRKPHDTRFACRVCLNLTYRSCQQAHCLQRAEQRFPSLAGSLGFMRPGLLLREIIDDSLPFVDSSELDC